MSVTARATFTLRAVILLRRHGPRPGAPHCARHADARQAGWLSSVRPARDQPSWALYSVGQQGHRRLDLTRDAHLGCNAVRRRRRRRDAAGRRAARAAFMRIVERHLGLGFATRIGPLYTASVGRYEMQGAPTMEDQLASGWRRRAREASDVDRAVPGAVRRARVARRARTCGRAPARRALARRILSRSRRAVRTHRGVRSMRGGLLGRVGVGVGSCS